MESFEDVKTEMAEGLFEQAEYACMKEDYDGAMNQFLKIVEIAPRDAAAHNNLGVLYWHKQDTEKALEHLWQATLLAPEEPSYILNYGEVLTVLEKFGLAKSLYTRFLNGHPENRDIAQALATMGEFSAQLQEKKYQERLAAQTHIRYDKQKLESIRSFLRFTQGKEKPRFPLDMYLEVSNVCDLKCVMCGVFSAINPHRQTNVRSTKRGFLDYASLAPMESLLAHALRVHCFGYGEPTIHPQFPEFIKHISRFEVLIDFFTNGMHLTDELVKFIVDSNVWEMTISFSGSTKMEYENVYQGGNFEHVLAGLARLRDYKKETDKKYPRVAVNSLAYRHHLLAFDRFVELMGSHGANIIFLKPLMEWGQTLPALTGHSALITPEINATVMKRAEDAARFYGVRLWISPELYVDSEAEERKKLLTLSGLTQEEFAKHKERIPVARFKEVAQETIPATNDNYTWDEVSKHDLLVMQPEEIRKILDVQRTELSQGTDKNFYCMEPFKVMYVMEDGHTKPCCNVPSFAPSLGNVMTHGGEPVWRGAGFAAYQDSILNNEYPLRGCRDCLRLKNGPRSHFFDQFLNEYFSWYSDVHGFDRSKDAFPELETLGDGTDVYHRFQAARP